MFLYSLQGSLALLSMLGSSGIILSYLFMKTQRKHPFNLVAFLALSDFFFALRIVLISAWWWDSQRLEQSEWMCTLEGIWYQFFGMASISWNGVISFNLIISLRYPFTNPAKYARVYHVFVTLMAVSTTVAVSFVNGLHSYGPSGDGTCWISGDKNLWKLVFFVPLVIYWALALLSFAVALLSYRYLQLQANVARGSIILRMLMFSFIFIVCWSGSLAHRITQYFGDTSWPFLYWDVIGVSLQGFGNALVWITSPAFFQGFRRSVLDRLPLVRGIETIPLVQGDVHSLDSVLRRQTIKFLLHGMTEAASDTLRLNDSNASPKPMDFADFQEYSRLRNFEGVEVNLFRFHDYAPLVFFKLRELDGLSQESYLSSIYPQRFLSRMSSLRWSEGRSGGFFVFSPDHKFIIKTIPKSEHKVFLTHLQEYYHYIYQNPNSLLTRVYGLHAISMVGGDRIYVIVMSNAFYSKNAIHERYDLKGSWVNRRVGRAHVANPRQVLGMDLDLAKRGIKVHVSPSMRNSILSQVFSDVTFLSTMNVMDYSLLVGLHFVDQEADDGVVDESDEYQSARSLEEGLAAPSDGSFVSNDLPDIGLTSPDGSMVYYLAIIDTLQLYNLNKRTERLLKVITGKDRRGISVQPPRAYRDRFVAMVGNLVVADGDDQAASQSGATEDPPPPHDL